MATQKQIDAILQKLDSIEGSLGGTLIGKDGMVIATRLDKRYAGDKIAALASDAVDTANKVITEGQFGKPNTMLIEGSDGKMCIINAAKAGIFITIIGTRELNIGMARMALQEAIDSFDDLS